MSIDFPTMPANNTPYPAFPTVPGVAYVYQTAEPAWRDIKGRAGSDNKLTNPAAQISQLRGMTNSANIDRLALADEWVVNYNANLGGYRGQLVASPTPRGGPNRMRISVITPDTLLDASEWLAFEHSIEGTKMREAQFGTANAKQLILRFGWKSPAGTWCVALRNSGVSRAFIAPFTITAGQANTDVEVVIIVPPCFDGAWNVNNNMWGRLNFSVCSGNTFLNTAPANANQWIPGNFYATTDITNGFATTGNTFELFDLGLYVDRTFTGVPPEWELPNITEELRRCQRYTAKVYGLRGAVATGTSCSRMMTALPVPMRTTPAMAIVGSPGIWDVGVAPVATAVGSNYSTLAFACIDITCGAGGFTGGRPASQYTQAATDYFLATAGL